MPLRHALSQNRFVQTAQSWTAVWPFRRAADSVQAVALLLVIFGVIWIWHLMSVALTAPMDNLEQLVWARSPQWGYHKHPPLPTLMLAFLAQWTNYSAMTASVLGGMCTLLSAAIYWNLLRQIWGRPAAYVGLLAALCITFYNGRLYYYNHNTVLMLCISMTVQSWWMILTTGRMRWWIALGLSAGLGMLSKYQYLVVLMPSVVLLWQLKPWHQRKHLRGLVWALLTALLVFMPHAVWLSQNDIANSPIGYALRSARPAFLPAEDDQVNSGMHSALWLFDLVLNRCLPALLLLLAVMAVSQPKSIHSSADHPELSGTRFLTLWGRLPVVSIVLVGLIAGLDLQSQWGTALAIWIIPLVMIGLRLHDRRICQQLNWIALALFLVIQALLLLRSYHTSAFGCCSHVHPQRWRLFDSQALANELEASARQAVGGRFTIIAGPVTTAGAVALALSDKPKVLIDHDLRKSPWIDPVELQSPGVLQLWPPNTGPSHRALLRSGWGWTAHTLDYSAAP